MELTDTDGILDLLIWNWQIEMGVDGNAESKPVELAGKDVDQPRLLKAE